MENEPLREAVFRAAGPKKLLLRSTSLPGDVLTVAQLRGHDDGPALIA